jgi:hypothetical protein
MKTRASRSSLPIEHRFGEDVEVRKAHLRLIAVASGSA